MRSHGPTYDEVSRYANERKALGYPPIDPRTFWAHYEQVGWMKFGTPIVKWKVTFREWEMREEMPELPPDRFRHRDGEHARYLLVRKMGRQEAREWTPEQCKQELAKCTSSS